MPEARLAHTRRAEQALILEAQRLLNDGVVDSLESGLRVACTTMDGAANKPGETVESVQTCTDLFAKEVPGLTSPDTITPRTDNLARSEAARQHKAEKGEDAVEGWLRLHDPQYGRTKKKWGR